MPSRAPDLERPAPIPPAAGSSAPAFLRLLADPRRPAIDADCVLLVVAHPDDETIGLGAQLSRLPGIGIVHVTDGAPRTGFDAARAGFPDPAAYAAARREELRAAMRIAGVSDEALAALDIPDQEAVANLVPVARRLRDLMEARRAEIVLTHAYEGGHPDHDACAFAVHAAVALIAREGGPAPAIVEMPYYMLAPDGGWRIQAFADEGAPETTIALGEAERDLKAAMLAEHRTQAAVLSLLPPGVERFRPAADHDFHRLPNGGALLYERQRWGMTGERWLSATRAAARELGIPA